MAKKQRKILNYDSQFRTLSIKVYDEQLPNGWESMCKIVRTLDKKQMQVLAICHYKDTVGDDYWKPSIEKAHYHIIVRVLDNKRLRVKQFLDTLGIVFREDKDKTLWENHGVESCENFTNMAVYATHDTDEAVRDGKTQYAVEEIVSNLTLEEIMQIREGYVRVSDSMEKVTPRVLAELDKSAYELGKGIGNFEQWYRAQPFRIRSQAKMRTIKESYEAGLGEGLKAMDEIPRLSVFVQSPPNLGKTYAAKHACKSMGMEYLAIEAGGTGKFDNLTVNTDAIIVDDECLPHPLAMADTKVCRVYRRHKNNPAWIGKFLCVTSNLSFDEWIVNKCGIKDEDEQKAARSRFYICHLEEVDGVYEIVCTSRAKRGAPQLKRDVREMYEKFRDLFNGYIAEHQAFDDEEDRYDVNSAAYNRKHGKETPPAEANARDLLEAEKAYSFAREQERKHFKCVQSDEEQHLWCLWYSKALETRDRVALVKWRIKNNYSPDRQVISNTDREEINNFRPSWD